MRNGTRIATVLLVSVFAVGAATQSVRRPVPTGVWGGKGMQLTVTAAGATIDYGCDAGTIDERLLSDPSGRFAAVGTHSFGRGGPHQPGDPSPKVHKTSYEGIQSGDTMRLTVSLPELERKLGEFTLELGRRASLERCG
jgi:hypothetical protein